jgi:bacillithiol biosynthesis deacetylase BshB1
LYYERIIFVGYVVRQLLIYYLIQKNMKIDLLAINAHPDDAELICGGTLLLHQSLGYKTGIIDLTEGELGTRGTVETRRQEAAKANEILQLTARTNLGLPDGFFEADKPSMLQLIAAIRSYQPEIVITNALHDRHSDHAKAARFVAKACFLAGLIKIETLDNNGQPQAAWRPKNLWYGIQDRLMMPDLIVDISDFYDKKREAIMAYSTQFYNPNSKEPHTPISTPDFLYFLEARAINFGREIGVKYGEGFVKSKQMGTKNLFQML